MPSAKCLPIEQIANHRAATWVSTTIFRFFFKSLFPFNAQQATIRLVSTKLKVNSGRINPLICPFKEAGD